MKGRMDLGIVGSGIHAGGSTAGVHDPDIPAPRTTVPIRSAAPVRARHNIANLPDASSAAPHTDQSRQVVPMSVYVPADFPNPHNQHPRGSGSHPSSPVSLRSRSHPHTPTSARSQHSSNTSAQRPAPHINLSSLPTPANNSGPESTPRIRTSKPPSPHAKPQPSPHRPAHASTHNGTKNTNSSIRTAWNTHTRKASDNESVDIQEDDAKIRIGNIPSTHQTRYQSPANNNNKDAASTHTTPHRSTTQNKTSHSNANQRITTTPSSGRTASSPLTQMSAHDNNADDADDADNTNDVKLFTRVSQSPNRHDTNHGVHDNQSIDTAEDIQPTNENSVNDNNQILSDEPQEHVNAQSDLNSHNLGSGRKQKKQRKPDDHTQARARINDKAAIRDWVVNYGQMRQRLQLAEKEARMYISSKRSVLVDSVGDIDMIAEIERGEYEEGERRGREQRYMRGEIDKLKKLVRKFRGLLGSPEDTEGYLNSLRSQTELIEEELLAYKTKQREKYHQLTLDERESAAEVQSLIHKFELWEKEEKQQENAVKRASTKPTPAPNSNSLPHEGEESHGLSAITSEIARIQSEIDGGGGLNGGWDERDHAYFLRLYTQLNNPYQLLQRAAAEIPHQTLATVTAHLEWYEHYLELHERRKGLIRDYNMMKKQLDKGVIQEETEKENKEREMKNKIKEQQLASEREEKAAQVAQWKEQRRAEQNAIEYERQMREEMIQAQKREKHEEERMRLKMLVESHSRNREIEAKLEDAIEAEKKAVDPVEAARAREARRRVTERQEMNIKLAALKHKAKLAQALQEEERKKQLIAQATPDVAAAVSRDPSRLTQTTAAAELRHKLKKQELDEAKHKVKSRANESVMAAPSMGGRAVAAWRQGL